jgi:hypothetical protein
MHTLNKISLVLLILLCACNIPSPGQPAPGTTEIPVTAPVILTDTPVQDIPSTECGFVWAREPQPELSQEFDKALKKALPQASGRAEAYGENCLNSQGQVVRFAAMETDYYVTLQVETLEDKQALGKLIEQVLGVLAQFPVETTPGPQPGYVGIAFKAPSDELNLWFTRRDAEAALENGLRGEELFNSLQAK